MNDLINRIHIIAKLKAEQSGFEWNESFSLLQITQKLGKVIETYTFPLLQKDKDPDSFKESLADLVLMIMVASKVNEIDLEYEMIKKLEQLEARFNINQTEHKTNGSNNGTGSN